jgi:hypothetical protein
MSRSLRVAWGSLGVSIVVLGMKGAAYWLTSCSRETRIRDRASDIVLRAQNPWSTPL